MTFQDSLRKILDDEERRTVSDSFGGPALRGKAPSFEVKRVVGWLLEHIEDFSVNSTVRKVSELSRFLRPNELKYVLGAAVRFAFLIELTNLSISSTKMKTRWLEGNIIKTRPDSYANYRGIFAP